MTEAQWLKSTDPKKMLAHLEDTLSDRKARLFACACSRCMWHLLDDPRSRAAVVVGERWADGEATAEEARAAFDTGHKAFREHPPIGSVYNATVAAAEAYMCCQPDVRRMIENLTSDRPRMPGKIQAPLLREVAGNPFLPPSAFLSVPCPACAKPVKRRRTGKSPCPACGGKGSTRPADVWMTPTVLSLAGPAYDARLEDGSLDPLRLAVLADALEEAGCTEGPVLAHLREPGPHVRGCWALDLVLGKG